ncbi:MAG TPA: TolC family protein, partial [Planctomycetota bacterium]|nr:TolC family protein [Planctomycetota bacterium]
LLDEDFRAEIALLNARQDSIDAEAAYAATLDAFKFNLNLPIDQPVVIVQEPVSMPRLALDTRLAIATAFANRLDWITDSDQLEDVRRNLGLARRELLPDLDLSGSLSFAGSDDNPWSDTLDDDPEYRLALSLEIPFNRRNERLSYERALVTVTRTQRDLEALRQRIIQEVYEDARALQRAQTSRRIQDHSRVQSHKRYEKAQIDFKAGIINNRELLEAQESVRAAETEFYAALSAYQSTELKLRRDTGILTIDAKGMWVADWPAYLRPEEDE